MSCVGIDAGRHGYHEYKDKSPGRGYPLPLDHLPLPLPKRLLDSEEPRHLPLQTPAELKQMLPAGPAALKTVSDTRTAIRNILMKKDSRLLVIVGPCSIHDEASALAYARRLSRLRKKAADTLVVIMRTYFEKPRTLTGWKGLLNDPYLDGTCDVAEGLRRARRILLEINGMGVPAAAEMLDPTTPPYIGDLISWSAVGARTTESQTHREMASGLDMPVGFKNATDGNLPVALNAILAARTPQTFPGIGQNGRTVIVKTSGNPWGHMVLRGGKTPNHHPEHIEDARRLLREKGLSEVILVDCSHGNANGDHHRQSAVWHDVIRQRTNGDNAIVGLMLESHLHEGCQPISVPLSGMAHGVSVTDACIGWEETEHLVMSARDRLKSSCRCRSAHDGRAGVKNISTANAPSTAFGRVTP